MKKNTLNDKFIIDPPILGGKYWNVVENKQQEKLPNIPYPNGLSWFLYKPIRINIKIYDVKLSR